MKSAPTSTFYRPRDTAPAAPEDASGSVAESFSSAPHTAGPWSPDAQHGGPPAALLGRALERLGGPESPPVVGRYTLDLLGPVPVGDLRVESRVLRPGRSVSLREATLYAAAGAHGAGRAVARAQAWTFPAPAQGVDAGPGTDEPLPHTPADGHEEEVPPSWHRGYLDAMDWSWIEGSVARPGRGVVWMRPRVGLVEGEEGTGLQRLLTCVDSASGVSSALDVRDWAFLNVDLSVHLLRPPVGEWFCLDARTVLGTGSIGTAVATVHDELGLVARSAQALLVVRR